MPITSLEHVGIYAQDLRKTVDFYSDFLGPKVTDAGWMKKTLQPDPIELEASDEELMQKVADLPQEWQHNTELPRAATVKPSSDHAVQRGR